MRRVVPQLIARGAVERASLGFQPAADPIARSFKISEGVLIQTAEAGSAAVAAGLLPTRRGLGGIVPGAAAQAGARALLWGRCCRRRCSLPLQWQGLWRLQLNASQAPS